MTVRNLEFLFRPRSVAVVAKPGRPNRYAEVVLRNLADGGFSGPVTSIAAKRRSLFGMGAHVHVGEIELAPDLAIICAALADVPQIIARLGARGTRAVIVGPALSGLLLGVGLALVYALDGVSFVVATVTSALLRPIPPAEGAGGLSPWQSTKEGLRYLRSRQALHGVYLIDINAMVFGMPRALFPAMAGAVFGGGTVTLGFLYAAPGVGALLCCWLWLWSRRENCSV
jgi:hypothetical protein